MSSTATEESQDVFWAAIKNADIVALESILIDWRNEVRPVAVKAVFRDWRGSSKHSSMDLTSRADLVAKLFRVKPKPTFLNFIGALSEARVQWWSPVIWRFKETGDAWKCFQIMLKDMNRELELSKDSTDMKNMYIKDIAANLTDWLVQGEHTDLQRFIESGIKLRGKSVLGDVADAIDLPSVIIDICRGRVVDTNGVEALNSNIKWFASLYLPSRGTARLRRHDYDGKTRDGKTSSEWSAQQALFECKGDAPDELILDAMELLITHFRPYAVNPCVFGRAILQALEEFGHLRFGNRLILLFLKFANTRLLCTWVDPTQNEIREYFGDNISHVFVDLFGDETISHKMFFSLMSHVFTNAVVADRDYGVSGWRIVESPPLWREFSISDMYKMLRLRPSDFAQEVREHENFWLKD